MQETVKKKTSLALRIVKAAQNRKVILKQVGSPGDIVMLSAAVRDLKLNHPDILVNVQTRSPAIWENNPYLSPVTFDDPNTEFVQVGYYFPHHPHNVPYHQLHAFRKSLELNLNLEIKPTAFKGDIHLSPEEEGWISQVEEMGVKEKFWVIFAGQKYDLTAKWWDPAYFQEVVDHFRGRITFVQCGNKGDWHPPLDGVINLVGKTTLRQVIRLIHHSIGVVTTVSFPMHAAAAIKTKYDLASRPCVVIAGGREPTQWEAYPLHRYLSTDGCLSCCDGEGCWRARCQKVGDGDPKDRENLCVQPIQITPDLRIPKCMHMIKPTDVIRAIESYYIGGVLKYNGG